MEVVWVGPRARMGICEAIPNRVVPHTTSGRADYFGPLVNRCVTSPTPEVVLPEGRRGWGLGGSCEVGPKGGLEVGGRGARAFEEWVGGGVLEGVGKGPRKGEGPGQENTLFLG